MRLLITGGFGTVGLVTLREAVLRGHEVTAFVRRSGRNERAARRFARRLPGTVDRSHFRVRWGDVRSREDLAAAVGDQDAVIHMAAILPPHCDRHPALCEAVNVGGAANVIAALEAEAARRAGGGRAGGGRMGGAPALVYASSVSVMGTTQLKEPPVSIDDPPRPSDGYSLSKVAAEASVRAAAIPWAVLRLAAVMPTRGRYRVSMARLMFDMALEARCEIVVDLDAAYALVRAAESLVDGGQASGKTVFIAGGHEKGSQMRIRDMIELNLAPLGLWMPRGRLFRTDVDSYYLDWYDTSEGQELLGYQRHSVRDWQRLSFRRFRSLRWALWPVRGLVWLYLECVGRRERASRSYSLPRSG